MTTSKMGVGNGSNGVGVVVEGRKELGVGSVVTRDGCVAISVGEDPTVEEACGAHAVKRTRMEAKTSDFIFVLTRSVF
jgi:hypothetical protein